MHTMDAHLVALDALAAAGAVQRGWLKGEALVSTRLALVLICLINGLHIAWRHACATQ